MSLFNSYSLYNTFTADNARDKSEGVAASGTTTYYSKMWSALRTWSLEVITSGTLAGTWTLWQSNKAFPDETTDTDWVDISTDADFVETNPAGAATKWVSNPEQLMGKHFRLKYVNASGTGNIFAYVSTN